MIAAITIERGCFKDGFVRGSKEKLDVSGTDVKWLDKWFVVLRQNTLTATSFRPQKNGGDTVLFELGLDGIARLYLEKENSRRLINESRVFRNQGSLDGVLYLVYNRNGHRRAFFHSEEFIAWKKEHHLNKVIRRNPSEYQIRDKRPSADLRVLRMGGFEIYSSGKLRIITDGRIACTDADCPQKPTRVSIVDAEWTLLEKLRGAHVERILVTEKPIYELRLPTMRDSIGRG